MAALSDQLLVATVLLYVAAMAGFTAEFAFGRTGAVARVAARQSVLAGGPTIGTEEPDEAAQPAGVAADGGRRPGANRAAARIGQLAVAATAAGAATQAACLVTRALAARRVPWGNMYEFIVMVSLVGVLVCLGLIIRRPRLRPLALVTTIVTLPLLALAAMRVYTPAGPLVPALNSYWLKIHVSAAAVATGFFLCGFVAVMLFLVRRRYEIGLARGAAPQGLTTTLGRIVPAADALERVAFRLHAFAMPVWTFAVIAGAVWAEAAWGRYWGWDPKEVWAFISWVVYAAYLHARATPSIRPTTTAWLAVAGWVTMMFNLFAVNLVISGLHSYA
ncbi:c-type cytochrome biogenesis protein CcsB [Dactylosporangium sp. NPDC005572]|uniref:c-type cytochrome biogenesis protein CcsB n=1 Tax=Dactylosporangium sp. NPDC005572 TaxID=3156889 RepID=UPI0033B2C87F